MQRTKYAVEFKDEAVKQVIDKGHSTPLQVLELNHLRCPQSHACGQAQLSPTHARALGAAESLPPSVAETPA